MQEYQPSQTEEKWQRYWAKEQLYTIDTSVSDTKKYFNLVMFPYPSGDRLHIGHWYNYGGTDIHGRFKRMQGYNVFQPMGFDSFGLPAENYAIKTGTPPAESTINNIDHMRKQLKSIGAMWDWNHEVVTSSAEYYRWTQWVFSKLYENDLCYKKKAPVNWCPSCQTVLANEQVQEGHCERCDSEVTKKDLSQWFFKITDYADKLLDHSELDWPEKTKLMQKNWIGKSKGCNVDWEVEGHDMKLSTFTTTVDTLFGVTFVVISPEHRSIMDLVTDENKSAVEDYINEAKKKTDIDRTAEGKEKSGVNTGAFVVNPLTGKKVPLWVADYVLMNYGTGVVMGVPAHDQRDMDFAKRYGFEIVEAIADSNGETFLYDDVDKYNVKGALVDSGDFTGMPILEAREAITKKLQDMNMGEGTIQFKLRDWLISRQRYWGAPIPVVYDPDGKAHLVPDEHLPWVLPTDVDYNPEGTAPLATSKELLERTEKIFGAGWTPEVDTMDTFVCSSWYYLRYPSANEESAAFNIEKTNNWLPVDMYIGGPEHACMHLLYARFINMALFELGYTKFQEPFKRLVHQGLITKEGAKMSKSKGNVVSPDAFVERFGSDVFRMYLMFMGPYTEGGDWSDRGITGIVRFRDKFWKLLNEESEGNEATEIKLHQTIKKVSADMENFHFNTAIAAMMEFVNVASQNGISQDQKLALVKIIAPLAPHFAEECWQDLLKQDGSIFNAEWPEFDPKKTIESNVEIAIQVNGKLRGQINVARDSEQSIVIDTASAENNISKYLEEGEIVKTIYVPNKLVNFVVR
jgi:leucyl-tRNA synthetase